MKYLILLIILCSLCTVNSNGFDTCLGEIVGSSTRGNATLRGDFPFVCALYNVEHNSMFCEGTLVTARHILTGSWLSCKWLMIKTKKICISSRSLCTTKIRRCHFARRRFADLPWPIQLETSLRKRIITRTCLRYQNSSKLEFI